VNYVDENLTLMAQIGALAENLDRAERALSAPQIDPELRKAVHNRFGWLIGDKKKELRTLRKQVEGGLSMDLCWEGFRRTRKECGDLFSECLAFLEGALVRSAGLDDGICKVADALLAYLSYHADIPWSRFTIMAEGEFFTRLTEIVRLRFPEFSVWNLPIAAHEFGHFVAEEIRKDGPSDLFMTILQGEGNLKPEERDKRFLHEQFADLFAVYALGPAFACTCILLHFDPGTADQDGREHPADAKRVHFILGALEEMDKADWKRPYAGIIKYLREMWQGSREAARKSEPLTPEIIGQLNNRLNELYVRVVDKRLAGVRYTSWSRASVLAPELLSDKEPAQLLKDFKGEITLPDLLNAAWLCRIQDWENSNQIGQRALGLCLASV
jgi:hypothetical protein